MIHEGYARIDDLVVGGQLVVLDGGVASEVGADFDTAERRQPAEPADPWAIYGATSRVLDVHRRYAEAGCDVISTNTWGILGVTGSTRGRRPGRTGLPAWTVATRDAVRLARQGIADAGRRPDCAVAFCLNDADPLLAGEEQLLSLLWTADPPDLVLVETLTELPSQKLLGAITEVAASGMPVWVSFKLARQPHEDTLRAGLAALEQAEVRAVLVNCVAPAETAVLLDALIGATALPVGCYPRLEPPLQPATYAEMALGWRAQGASIIGGCCGVGPAHIAAVRAVAAQAEA